MPAQLRRHALRHLVQHRVPRQEHVLREAAPEMRRALGRGVAVAHRVRVAPPVGRRAEPIFALMAPFALEAGHVVLDEDEVAFLDPLALDEAAARLDDGADILVPHDDRRVRRRLGVELHVGAADAGDLHLEQRALLRNLRHRIFAQLGLMRAGAHRRQYLFRHAATLSAVGFAQCSPVRAAGKCRSPRLTPAREALAFQRKGKNVPLEGTEGLSRRTRQMRRSGREEARGIGSSTVPDAATLSRRAEEASHAATGSE